MSEKKRRGLTASIYRSHQRFGDSTNGGASSKVEQVLLVGPDIDEIFEERPDCPAFRIVRRPGLGKKRTEYIHAEPIDGKSPGKVGWMFGGNFIYSSDSRFPSDYPIPIHDRQETQAQYDAPQSRIQNKT